MKIHLRPPRTGLLTRMLVYHDDKKVGIAFQVWANELTFPPVLSTEDGEPLEEDWYSLQIISREIAVINMRIQ